MLKSLRNLLLLGSSILFAYCSSDPAVVEQPITTPSPPASQEVTKPLDYSYRVIKDLSNDALEKNEIYVELSKKISQEELTNLANELYATKPRHRRFYIFYSVKGIEGRPAYWAISHFDPDLKVEIIGTTEKEEQQLKETPKVDGKIIGQWYEEHYTSASYILFQRNKTFFMKMTFKDGSSSTDQVVRKKVSEGYRITEREESSHGEYYIYHENGNLDFYNSKNEVFTTGIRVN